MTNITTIPITDEELKLLNREQYKKDIIFEFTEIFKGIPKSEKIVLKYSNKDKLLYIVTLDIHNIYKLYSFDEKTLTATFTKHKSISPIKLNDYMI